MRLVARDGSDALHEIEDGLRRTAFLRQHPVDDLAGLGLGEAPPTQEVGAVFVRSGDDPLAGVRSAMDGYLDFHAQNGTLLRILVEQAIRSDSALAPLRKRFRARLVEVLARAATARGRRSFDPLLGVALISALEGVSLEILETGATPADVARAKGTMHALLAHVFG